MIIKPKKKKEHESSEEIEYKEPLLPYQPQYQA